MTLREQRDAEQQRPQTAGELSPTGHAAEWLCRNASLVIAGALAATALLALPFILMPPSATASQQPSGEVFEAQDLAVERFASRVFRPVYIVEARGGDLLRRQPLLELWRNLQALRRDANLGPKLFSYRDSRRAAPVKGVYSLADAVDGALRARGVAGLEAASEQQVKAAASAVVDAVGQGALGLSVEARRDPSSRFWVSPALVLPVLADNQALGGGGYSTTLGARDTTKESFAREIQRTLRGDQRHLRVWGLAIDVNLTSAEQGRSAGPFIGMTLLAVLLLVGLVFRSYWAVAVTGFSLGALIIWLKGLSNLLGLKNDQILSIIVPIAMISFGVDFAFHALGRYREESAASRVGPRRALGRALAGVLGALTLALASDVAAFLSNTISGIESLVQFGLAAALALVAAFLMLGLASPLMLMQIEQRLQGWRPRRSALALGALGAVLAGLCVMASVVFCVFVEPWIGVALLGGYLALFLGLPLLVLGRRQTVGAAPAATRVGGNLPLLGRIVAGLARRRAVVLPLTLALTGVSVYSALRIEANFDVRDFFSPATDFVVALDKFDRHVAGRGGEPAGVYVEGPLTHPPALAALKRFVEQVRRLDSDRLARSPGGQVSLEPGVLGMVQQVLQSPAARAAVEASGGVRLTDRDADGIPDTRQQVAALFRFTRRAGVPRAGGPPALTPDAVLTLLWESGDGRRQATRVGLRIPGSRAQENIRQVQALLQPLVRQLSDRLRALDPGARAVLTGQPIVRQATLDAVFRSFLVSLPVAVLLCLVVSALFMRSLRLALVNIVPILLVVAWLYGLMQALGYSINVVTATIGAISIGIGIDFAVHFTMRYREELTRHPRPLAALEAAGAGTGGALLASGLSSMIGFAILAFAPMPMFAAYGLLTAIMIFLASVASLVVLPSLLILVSDTPT